MRREVNEQRQRDPIVAEAIHTIGTLIVCLVPLIVAAYALLRMGKTNPEGEELAEILVRELAGENPILLPLQRAPALENRTANPPHDEPRTTQM
jgi:hypothetical protein